MKPDDLTEYLQRNLGELTQAPRGPQRVVATIGRLSSEYPDSGLTPAQAADLEGALRRVREVRSRYGPDDTGVVVELMLLGKLGRFGEAIEAGRRAYADAPNWSSATALANAL